MTLTLFGHPVSQPTRAVMWLLAINKIPHENKVLNIQKGEARTPEFKAVNPNAKVPAITDGDFKLHESNAILGYICDKFKLSSWYPTDLLTRSRINQYLHWHHSNTRMVTLDLFRPVLVATFSGTPVDPTELENGTKTTNKVLTMVTKEYLDVSNGPFMFGTNPTIADLALYCELDQLKVLSLFNFDKHPKIAAWMSQMEKLPAFEETQQGLLKFASYVKKKSAETPSKL
eukprot:TRINITY_DN267_c0_g1_i9.p1 TRINITY_DN267_c0_g1~~TRINITY_DN267_c0_g1_i9.p1  ORF type:complete len:230 (+),score=54.31 TRINITY_DN267_c0_g1_i9:69-758(+)